MKNKIVICLLALLIAVLATFELSISKLATNSIKYEVSLSDTSTIKEINVNNNEISFDEESDIVQIDASVIDDIKIEYDGELIVTNSDNIQVLDETGEGDGVFLSTVNKKDILFKSINKTSIIYFVVCYFASILSLMWIKHFKDKYKDNTDSFKIYDILILAVSILAIFFILFYILLYILDVAVIVLPLALVFYFVYSMKNNLYSKKENLYVILAVVLGITMIFVLPPFNAPDEYAHFVKSYTTATFSNDEGITHLPVALESFYDKYGHDVLDTKFDFEAKSYLDDLMQSGEYTTLSENDFVYTNTKYLKVLPYIPSIVGIAIFKFIGASPLIISVIGRFLSLLVMLVMYYLAIKNTPILKRVFLVVCMFPIVLHQAIINQDYLTSATVALIVAFVLKYKYEKIEIGAIDITKFAVLGLMLSCCKFGYFVFLPLILLIPNNLFKNTKVAIAFKALFILIPVLISFTGNVVITQNGDTVHYTIGYSLSHPVDAIKVFAKTFWQRAELDLLRGQFDGFGVSTKWNNGFISSILYIIYILFFFTSEKEDKVKLQKVDRITLIVVALLLIGVIYAAMYLNWTNLGEDTIDGLQPRYFTPAVLCLALALSNSILKIDVKNKERLDTILICVVYVCVFSTMILGFYA